MDLFGTLIAVFIGVGLVSKEIERRSLYPLLAKPLSRDEFFLGKFAGLAFTLLVNLSVMTAGLYAHPAGAPAGAVDPLLLAAVYPIFLGLAAGRRVRDALLDRQPSSTLAAVFTVGVVVAGRFSDVVRQHARGRSRRAASGWSTLLYAVAAQLPQLRLQGPRRVRRPGAARGARLGHASTRLVVCRRSCSGSGWRPSASRDFQ